MILEVHNYKRSNLSTRGKFYNPWDDNERRNNELRQTGSFESYFSPELTRLSDKYIPNLKKDLDKIESKITYQKNTNLNLEKKKIGLNTELKYYEIGAGILAFIILLFTVVKYFQKNE